MNKFNGGRRQLLESLIHNKKNFVVQHDKLRTNSRLVHSITNVKSTIDNRLHVSSSIQQKIRGRLRTRIQSEQRQIVASENRRFLTKMTEIMNRRNTYLHQNEEKKRDLQAVLLYQESGDLLHYPGISDRQQDSVQTQCLQPPITPLRLERRKLSLNHHLRAKRSKEIEAQNSKLLKSLQQAKPSTKTSEWRNSAKQRPKPYVQIVGATEMSPPRPGLAPHQIQSRSTTPPYAQSEHIYLQNDRRAVTSFSKHRVYRNNQVQQQNFGSLDPPAPRQLPAAGKPISAATVGSSTLIPHKKLLMNTRLMQQSVLENLQCGSFYDYEAQYQYTLNQELQPPKRAKTSQNFYNQGHRTGKSQLVESIYKAGNGQRPAQRRRPTQQFQQSGTSALARPEERDGFRHELAFCQENDAEPEPYSDFRQSNEFYQEQFEPIGEQRPQTRGNEGKARPGFDGRPRTQGRVQAAQDCFD